MITKLYRRFVPSHIRTKIYRGFLQQIFYIKDNFKLIIKAKAIRIAKPFLKRSNENEVYSFMGKYGVNSYPFITSKNYRKESVTIFTDPVNKMPFVIHNEKKLFFPKSFTENRILYIYKALLTEQDNFSPHRYIEDYLFLKDKVLLDAGAAEGIFALDTIEFTTHTYLFECDPVWIEALHFTFLPWKDKVSIIQKKISNVQDEETVTIDMFFKGKNIDRLFIKMDIEGDELNALKGMKNLLQEKNDIFLAVCTYHKPNDPEEITSFLKKLGYTYQFNQQGSLFYNNRIVEQVLLRSHK